MEGGRRVKSDGLSPACADLQSDDEVVDRGLGGVAEQVAFSLSLKRYCNSRLLRILCIYKTSLSTLLRPKRVQERVNVNSFTT